MSVRFAMVLTLVGALVLVTPSAIAGGGYSFSDMTGSHSLTYSYWHWHNSSYPPRNFGCEGSDASFACLGAKSWNATSWSARIGDGSHWGHGYNFTSPVPEPETYAMLLAGLGLMGFLMRRRMQPAAST